MKVKPLIIAWAYDCERIQTMATELQGKASLQYASGLTSRWLLPLRYMIQAWNTWHLLEQEQPGAVIIQAPPIFAPLTVALWCKLRGKGTMASKRPIPYVIDAHTGAFHHRSWRWSLPLLRFLARRAAITLVTDDAALSLLQSWKAQGLFLPDALPTLSPATCLIGSQGKNRVALISTFSDVEPIEEVYSAARLLPDVTFYITGDTKKAAKSLLAHKPENVVLTGYLQGGNYTALLENVQGLVILTTEPNSLSCGAYEAVTVGRPVIASKGPEMQKFFTRGFVYVANTPKAIADGIQYMLNEREELTAEITAMRSEFFAKRQPNFEKFVAVLEG